MSHSLDAALSVWVNSSVGAHPVFDLCVRHLANNYLLKSLPLFTAFWFLWWKDDAQRERRRSLLLMCLVSCFASMAVVRGLTKILPFRIRPIADPSMGLHPVGTIGTAEWFDRMSSFPSDHAGLFFGLAVSLFIVSRPVGIWAMLHVLILVLLPRVYLGLHYPGDVLGGGLIGAAFAILLSRQWAVDRWGRPAVAQVEAHPPWAYAGLFLLTFEMASMFESARDTAGFIRDLLLR